MSGAPRERTVGIILLAVSAVLLLLAITIGWTSFTRWKAVRALNQYHLAVISGNKGAAKDAAEIAASVRDDAALVLPSLDLLTVDAGMLARLRRDVPAHQRAIVDTALAFRAALQDGDATELDGADGRLLTHLAALRKGNLPDFPVLAQGDVVHTAILDRCCQAHIAAAWRAGDAKALREPLEILVLLHPDHPEFAKAQTLLAAIGRGASGTAASFSHDIIGDRVAFYRQLVVLAPEHKTSFIRLIPENDRTSAEIQAMLMVDGASGDLKAQVKRAEEDPTEPTIATLFRRCMESDEDELALRLIKKAPASIKTTMQLALAIKQGDLAQLVKLQPERTDLKAKISPPIGREKTISFHLTTESGLIPRDTGLEIRLNQVRIAPERIRRLGSLIVVEFRGMAASTEMEVKLNDAVVFSGTVRL
jgi:hypothetical protein